jgi:transcriptional regulator with XRE-family HTH domain
LLMAGDLQRALARNLRNFREAEEASPEVFAERVGFRQAQWAGIERGEQDLSLQSIEKIAAELNIEPLLLLESVRTER